MFPVFIMLYCSVVEVQDFNSMIETGDALCVKLRL